MSWECRDGVVRMSGDCGILPGAVLEREMRLSPEGFSFRLKSAVRPVKKGLNTVLMLKHRPEMRMFRTLGAPSVNLMMPENGRLKARALQTGSACETHENAYVVADSAGGVLLGIRYENADNLYFWYDKEYFAPEAMGRKLNIGERPSMTVDYFVVHGMSRADFIGVDTVLALAEKPLTVQENSAYQLDVVCGSAVRLRNPRLKVHFLNEAGKFLAEKEGAFQAPAPGFATAFPVALPCEKLPAGAYRLELCLSSGGEILLTGRTGFRVLSKNDLKRGEERLKEINQAIDTVRTEFRKGGDRQELMKRFRSLIEQRKKLEDAISSGDQTVLDTLLREPRGN